MNDDAAPDRDSGLDVFNRIVGVTSKIEVFLKCHLILEYYLEAILRAHSRNAAVLSLQRLTFAQKLNMSEGFGFIDKSDASEIRTINQIRNKMAHGLGFEVTATVLEEIQSALSPRSAALYDTMLESGRPSPSEGDRLAWLFFSVIWSVGHILQMARYEKENEAALAAYRQAMALDEVLGDGKKLIRTSERRSPDQVREAIGLPPRPEPRQAIDLLLEATGASAPPDALST